ncbi:MAG: type 1 glutamine amidotransferase [Hyphomicrobiales bacterium]|nr:type 1 glutamine amidotransferase [Hyphomicrobiales bacterium]MCP5374007.1 type 1 glutamine amidotransferase [Hyphomicrobiales bacterium]
MTAPRILLVDGAPPGPRENLIRIGGTPGWLLYEQAVAHVAPDFACDRVQPADPDCSLPAGAALADYDGAIMPGSALHVYDDEPQVTRQLDFARALFEAGVPMFGACWGTQVACVVAGGAVAASQWGREIGIARKIALTAAGRGHPLYAGKAPVFDGIAFHLDEITHLPPGGVVLSGNRHSAVQALTFIHRGNVFWGVQYHPEFTVNQIARLYDLLRERMLSENLFATDADITAYIAKLDALRLDPTGRRDLGWLLGIDDDILDPDIRTRELANWITHRVRPAMAARRRSRPWVRPAALAAD